MGKHTSLFVKNISQFIKNFLGTTEGTYLFAKIITQVFIILFGCENALAYLWKMKLGQEKVFKILANEWMNEKSVDKKASFWQKISSALMNLTPAIFLLFYFFATKHKKNSKKL
jgi:hypothetical protein